MVAMTLMLMPQHLSCSPVGCIVWEKMWRGRGLLTHCHNERSQNYPLFPGVVAQVPLSKFLTVQTIPQYYQHGSFLYYVFLSYGPPSSSSSVPYARFVGEESPHATVEHAAAVAGALVDVGVEVPLLWFAFLRLSSLAPAIP